MTSRPYKTIATEYPRAIKAYDFVTHQYAVSTICHHLTVAHYIFDPCASHGVCLIMGEFYYHDNKDTEDNFTEPHHLGQKITEEELAKIGVFYRKVPTLDQLDQIANDRKYRNRDEITLNLETFKGDVGAYNAKMQQFYKEHYHEDEEIRYIVEGEGYFDVRDKGDRWIRAKLDPQDLLVLPAGIYHRFTLTNDSKHVKAIRLFKDEPKWEAINRGEQVDSQARQDYVQSIAVN